MTEFIDALPKHNCDLILTHNTHKSYYQTVEQFEQDFESHFGKLDWVSEEQRAKAIATNELWNLHWYPNTPISSYSLYACDLSELLKAAKE